MKDPDASCLFLAMWVSALRLKLDKNIQLDIERFPVVMDTPVHNKCLQHKAEEWTAIQLLKLWC